MRLSFIVPVLDEEDTIRECLQPLQSLRGKTLEVIVVDGGSADGTVQRAGGLADRILHAERGRAAQMNAGAAAAAGDIFVFLHADTRLGAAALRRLAAFERDDRIWGRFDVQLSGAAASFRVIAFFMNLRSRITGIATGDQVIFVARPLFERAEGYTPLPLMEDVDLCRRLRRIVAPLCLRERVITSSRRWERHGIWRTVFRMWKLRLQFFFGVPAGRLAREYNRG